MATSGDDDPTGTADGMAYFPDLKRGVNAEKTSDESDAYNCIGWALGDEENWWCHLPDGTWPPSVPRSPKIEALVAVFELHRYEKCSDGNPEPGFEKVALFVMPNGEWSHAARQRPAGGWMSKLGPYEDIRHDAPDLVCGVEYGSVHCYMRRKHEQPKPAEGDAPAESGEQRVAPPADAGASDPGYVPDQQG